MMATFLIALAVQAILLASTFSPCAWATDNNLITQLGNHHVHDSNTTTNEAPAKFHHSHPTTGTHPGGHARRVTMNATQPQPGDCKPQDISITQRQMPGTGIPRFQVAITNTCTDPECSIRSIIAYCGQFTTAHPIDPNVFRRVGGGPNCVVNNYLPMAPGQSLSFRYDSEYIEPIRLASAEPVCRQ